MSAPAVIDKTKSPGPLKSLQNLLESHKSQIAMALPKHMTPERMIRVAMTATSVNPQLMDCDSLSVAASIVQASIMGLEPNSVLGECYLVPFYNKKRAGGPGLSCQLIPGYLGLVKLARNSDQVAMVDAQPVHENDEFELVKGSAPQLFHRIPRTGDRGKIQGYWAGYSMKDGTPGNYEYLTVEQIEEHRDKYSQGAYRRQKGGGFALDSDGNRILQGPWKDAPDWMYRKTVLRLALKLAPKSVELRGLQTAMAIETQAEAQKLPIYPDVPLSLCPPAADDEDDEIPPPDPKSLITNEQKNRLQKIWLKTFEGSAEQYTLFLKAQGFESADKITQEQFEAVVAAASTKP